MVRSGETLTLEEIEREKAEVYLLSLVDVSGVGLSHSPTPFPLKLLSTSIIYGMMLHTAIYVREQSAAWRIKAVKKGGCRWRKKSWSWTMTQPLQIYYERRWPTKAMKHT